MSFPKISQWNADLALAGGGCSMPRGALPKIQCLAVIGKAIPWGFINPSDTFNPADVEKKRYRKMVERWQYSRSGYTGFLWIERAYQYSVGWTAGFKGGNGFPVAGPPASPYESPRQVFSEVWTWGGFISNGVVEGSLRPRGPGLDFETSPSSANMANALWEIAFFTPDGTFQGFDGPYNRQSIGGLGPVVNAFAVSYLQGKTWAENMGEADAWLQANGPVAMTAQQNYYAAWLDGPMHLSPPPGAPVNGELIGPYARKTVALENVFGGQVAYGITARFLRYRWRMSACGSVKVRLFYTLATSNLTPPFDWSYDSQDLTQTVVQSDDCTFSGQLFLAGSPEDAQWDEVANFSSWNFLPAVAGLVPRATNFQNVFMVPYESDYADVGYDAPGQVVTV